MRNLFSEIIKNKYRALGLRGRNLAIMVGCSPSSFSQYLSGDVRMPAPVMVALMGALRVSAAAAADIQLAHDLLHVPESVRGYIARLEQMRRDQEACSRQLVQLGLVISDMERTRGLAVEGVNLAPGPWAPLVHEPPKDGPGQGSSSVFDSIPSEGSDDDDPGVGPRPGDD